MTRRAERNTLHLSTGGYKKGGMGNATHRMLCLDSSGTVTAERAIRLVDNDDEHDVRYYADDDGGTYVDHPDSGIYPTNDAALSAPEYKIRVLP